MQQEADRLTMIFCAWLPYVSDLCSLSCLFRSQIKAYHHRLKLQLQLWLCCKIKIYTQVTACQPLRWFVSDKMQRELIKDFTTATTHWLYPSSIPTVKLSSLLIDAMMARKTSLWHKNFPTHRSRLNKCVPMDRSTHITGTHFRHWIAYGLT